MKKLLLILSLGLFFCLGGKAQERTFSFKVVMITSGTYSNLTQSWTYDPTTYPKNMLINTIDNTIYIQDQAHSFYRMGNTRYAESIENGYSRQSWYAIDERNRDCTVTMRTKLATRESSISVMYDLGAGNFQLFQYTFFLN